MSTAADDWVCPTCGIWVPPGSGHYCFGTGNLVSQPGARAPDPYFVLQEIAAELRRIADALERMDMP